MEAEVYIYLAKKGPLKIENLALGLGLRKNELGCILKNLQDRSLVTTDIKHQKIYHAKAIEEVLEIYIKRNLEEAQKISKTKKELANS